MTTYSEDEFIKEFGEEALAAKSKLEFIYSRASENKALSSGLKWIEEEYLEALEIYHEYSKEK